MFHEVHELALKLGAGRRPESVCGERRGDEEQCKKQRGDPFVPPQDERDAGDKLQRAPGHDERRDERGGSAVGRKLVGGSCQCAAIR